MNHTSSRVAIVGGGFAGLSVATRLALAGLPVTVLDASQIGSGASTRNQGWLHSGAWFAPRQTKLAQMCYESLQQTLEFCPESVEVDPRPMIYVLPTCGMSVERLTSAWDAAGIPHKALTAKVLFERLPELAISQAQCGFELPDRSMRTDLLLARLADAAERAGAEIRTGTEVRRLVVHGGKVHGVELGAGETISARLVVLAGNTRGGSLFPGFGAHPVGVYRDVALVVRKTHLVAAQPALTEWPFCIADSTGLNHVPHRPVSVFGTNRWIPASHGEDEASIASEVRYLWNQLNRFFPDFCREGRRITEWAGVTAMATQIARAEADVAPVPLVIDHAREQDGLENLLSVFPGRATLWARVALHAEKLVLKKLGARPRTVARPPWDRGAGSRPLHAGASGPGG